MKRIEYPGGLRWAHPRRIVRYRVSGCWSTERIRLYLRMPEDMNFWLLKPRHSVRLSYSDALQTIQFEILSTTIWYIPNLAFRLDYLKIARFVRECKQNAFQCLTVTTNPRWPRTFCTAFNIDGEGLFRTTTYRSNLRLLAQLFSIGHEKCCAQRQV